MSLKEKFYNIREKIKNGRKVLKGEKSLDKVYSSERVFPNEDLAKTYFQETKKKLFHINWWSTISGPENSRFKLYNKHGQASAMERPLVDDYIKIELPGPFPENWVKVIDVQDKEDFAQFVVCPSTDPTNKEQPESVTEHFFKSEASSTFRVERKGNTIKAYEIGKHEAINNKGKEAGERPVLNTLISEGGWTVFQRLQWESLTNFLVGNK